MKLFFTSIAFLGMLSNFSSQSLNVPFQKKPFFTKTTASWCGPCGTYLSVSDSIHDIHHDSIVFINAHISSSSVGDNYSGNFHNIINGGGGIPAYNVDGYKLLDWPPSYNSILSYSIAQIAKPIIANVAFNSTINGNNLTVNTTTEFFENSSGEFYINVFVVENNLNIQQYTVINGYIPTTQDRVSRGPILDGNSGMWGEQIANGTVTSGSRYDVSFSTTLDNSWIASNLEIVAVIWQKDATGNYETLNSEDKETPIASTIENSSVSKINIYPNPTSDLLYLEGINERQEYELIDNSGKKVKEGKLTKQLNTISLVNLAKGNYLLRIKGSKRISLQKIIKQ